MDVLEKDLIAGTFTHRLTYVKRLTESFKRLYPNVEFIVQYSDKPIIENFNLLREKFVQSGKRFWLFLDDDIELIFEDTLRDALHMMVAGRYAICGVCSTFDPSYKEKVRYNDLEVHWVPGYFQLVDSRFIGDIKADTNLPHPNTAIDTTFCIQAKMRGYRIGLCGSYLYHQYKNTPVNYEALVVTNEYIQRVYGDLYFYWVHQNTLPNIVGEIPKEAGNESIVMHDSEE